MATFLLPKGCCLKINAIAQANYTQAADINMYILSHASENVLYQRIQLYRSASDFVLPAKPFDFDVLVVIQGSYLYTDTKWGISTEKLWESSSSHLVIGYDDSRHYNPDNDYNDLILDISITKDAPALLSARTLIQSSS